MLVGNGYMTGQTVALSGGSCRSDLIGGSSGDLSPVLPNPPIIPQTLPAGDPPRSDPPLRPMPLAPPAPAPPGRSACLVRPGTVRCRYSARSPEFRPDNPHRSFLGCSAERSHSATPARIEAGPATRTQRQSDRQPGRDQHTLSRRDRHRFGDSGQQIHARGALGRVDRQRQVLVVRQAANPNGDVIAAPPRYAPPAASPPPACPFWANPRRRRR
jgi:hypothetical protein